MPNQIAELRLSLRLTRTLARGHRREIGGANENRRTLRRPSMSKPSVVQVGVRDQYVRDIANLDVARCELRGEQRPRLGRIDREVRPSIDEERRAVSKGEWIEDVVAQGNVYRRRRGLAVQSASRS